MSFTRTTNNFAPETLYPSCWGALLIQMLWLWLVVLIRRRQELKHFCIGHAYVHCLPRQGTENSLGSLQRNHNMHMWYKCYHPRGTGVGRSHGELGPRYWTRFCMKWWESLGIERSHYCGYWSMVAFPHVLKIVILCEIDSALRNLSYCSTVSISNFKEASASYLSNWLALTRVCTQNPNEVICSADHFSLLLCW